MVETTTLNYKWTKPELQKSPTTWGKFLNDNLDSIDSLVFTNQQALVPIGTIVMFGGATAPPNWLICAGQQIDTTVYAKLFAVIGNAFGGVGSAGNFMLPNLGAQFPIGAGTNKQGRSTGLGGATGSFTVPIAVGNLPSHAHPITDVVHSHGLNQTPHAHGDSGHTHGVNESPHLHGSNLVKSGAGSAGLFPGGGFPIAGAGNTDGASTGISIQSDHANITAINANITIDASYTNLSTTQAVGSGVALDVVPPFVCLNFLIRYQ